MKKESKKNSDRLDISRVMEDFIQIISDNLLQVFTVNWKNIWNINRDQYSNICFASSFYYLFQVFVGSGRPEYYQTCFFVDLLEAFTGLKKCQLLL